jgi:hypothetical protein
MSSSAFERKVHNAYSRILFEQLHHLQYKYTEESPEAHEELDDIELINTYCCATRTPREVWDQVVDEGVPENWESARIFLRQLHKEHNLPYMVPEYRYYDEAEKKAAQVQISEMSQFVARNPSDAEWEIYHTSCQIPK